MKNDDTMFRVSLHRVSVRGNYVWEARVASSSVMPKAMNGAGGYYKHNDMFWNIVMRFTAAKPEEAQDRAERYCREQYRELADKRLTERTEEEEYANGYVVEPEPEWLKIDYITEGPQRKSRRRRKHR